MISKLIENSTEWCQQIHWPQFHSTYLFIFFFMWFLFSFFIGIIFIILSCYSCLTSNVFFKSFGLISFVSWTIYFVIFISLNIFCISIELMGSILNSSLLITFLFSSFIKLDFETFFCVPKYLWKKFQNFIWQFFYMRRIVEIIMRIIVYLFLILLVILSIFFQVVSMSLLQL